MFRVLEMAHLDQSLHLHGERTAKDLHGFRIFLQELLIDRKGGRYVRIPTFFGERADMKRQDIRTHIGVPT